PRTFRPEAEPHILLAGAVVLDRDQKPSLPQGAAGHLEVPAVIGPAVGDANPLAADRLAHLPHPSFRLRAALRPDRGRTSPRQPRRPGPAASPRRQPVANATIQPGERL